MEKIMNIFNSIKISFKINIALIIIILMSLSVVVFVSLDLVKNSLIKQARESSYQVIKQTGINVKLKLEDIDDFAISLSRNNNLADIMQKLDKEKDPLLRERYKGEINQFLTNEKRFNRNLTAILVVTNNGHAVVSDFQSISDRTDILEIPSIKKYIESNAKSKWFDTYIQDITNIDEISVGGRTIALFKNIYSDTSLKPIGFAAFYINEQIFYDIVKDVHLPSSGSFAIVGSNNNILVDPKERDHNGLKIRDINNYFLNDDVYNTYANCEGSLIKDNIIYSYSSIRDIFGTDLNWSLISYTKVNNVIESIRKASLQIVILGVLSLVLGSLLSMLITKNITCGIKKLISSMDRIKEGNLDINLVNTRKDEIGSLTDNFVEMSHSIRKLIKHLSKASNTSRECSWSLTSSCQENYSSYEELSIMIDDIQELMNTLNTQVKYENDNIYSIITVINSAKNKLDIMDSTVSESEKLNINNKEAIRILSDTFENINLSLSRISYDMGELIESSKLILKITNVITDISKQTKLLSINAAVESAKIKTKELGDIAQYGKSFGLIADEIRKLSERSKSSAENINKIIQTVNKEIQNTKQSVDSMESVIIDSKSKINNVINSFERSSDFQSKIVETIVELQNSTNSLGTSSEDIIHSINTINTSSDNISDHVGNIITLKNDQLTMNKNLVEKAGDLSELTEELESVLSNFIGF